MTFDPKTVYDELHPYFQKRVQRHEPLARHAAFGVGGPADVWLSLESKEELLDLVRLCAQEHWPLLVVGNGTNVLFADAGVRGMVARVALGAYHIEERSDGSALRKTIQMGNAFPTPGASLLPGEGLASQVVSLLRYSCGKSRQAGRTSFSTMLRRSVDYAASHHCIPIQGGSWRWSDITFPSATATDPSAWPRARTRPTHCPPPPTRGAPAHPHRPRRCRQNAPGHHRRP